MPAARKSIETMNDDLQKRIAEAIANPRNIGELPNADAVGTVGNSECGEMLRMWIKYKEERGRKVIDKATFQSFGCETAIAVASLATELIKGKTAQEALSLKTDQLAGELGPLPPMKIHCAELVQGALRSALGPEAANPASSSAPSAPQAPGLLDSFSQPKAGGVKIVFLDDEHGGESAPPGPRDPDPPAETLR
jgi:NifU-like protein involved in Fe-S cluster formation